LAPELPAISIDSSGGWGIAPEGKTEKDSSDATVLTLPVFNSSSDRKYFIDLFLSNKKAINWQMTATSKWIKVSQDKGVLKPVAGQEDARIWVSVDWGKFPKETAAEGTLVFTGDGKVITVQVKATDDKAALPVNFKGFVEDNGYLSLLAKHYTRSTAKQHAYWQKITGLGPVETSLIAMPLQQKAGVVMTDELQTTAPCLEYDYYTFTAGIPEIKIYTLPVHPLNNHLSLRYGVAIDDGPITVLDHKTYGRSQEWKQNVLSNTAVKSVKGNLMDKGWHTLKIYMIDPGVVLQYITIDVGGLKQAYSIIPETKKQ
jgi:hypothetical protein